MKRFIFFIALFLTGQLIFSQQNTTVDCSAGPVSTTFCYDTGQDNSYTFTSNDGTPLNLTIDEGQVETNWDELEIRDSDGTVLYNGYGNGGPYIIPFIIFIVGRIVVIILACGYPSTFDITLKGKSPKGLFFAKNLSFILLKISHIISVNDFLFSHFSK